MDESSLRLVKTSEMPCPRLAEERDRPSRRRCHLVRGAGGVAGSARFQQGPRHQDLVGRLAIKLWRFHIGIIDEPPSLA